MSTTCAITATFFLLSAMATTVTTTTTTFHLQAIEIVKMIQTEIVQTRNSIQTTAVGLMHSPASVGGNWSDIGVALGDCKKLYDESESLLAQLVAAGENHTGEDARTWLSGVLANHRTCLDGLAEQNKGSVVIETDDDRPAMAQNLTFLLGEALALYAKGSDKGLRTGVAQGWMDNHHAGILTSWNPVTSKANFIVAQDGSSTHRTINDAVAALGRMGRSRPRRVIIYVKQGVYNEKVEIEKHTRNVMFVGDGMDKTIVTGSRNVPDGSSTLSSATFGVSGDGFWARDMTFENTAGPHKHQAVALRVSSDHSAFYRCSFKAYQDTLFVHSLRQFYRDCHIYGTIDFIFGDASAVFQNCDIFVRRPMSQQANFITAQGRDNPYENTGISIHKSRVRPAPDFSAVMRSFRSYLGRPWKKYSRTVIMETDLDGLIDPRGWREWDGNFALATLFYAEYMNTGNGASTDRRVKWPGFHVLNSPREAGPFTVSRFIQGQTWIPATGVPFEAGI